MTNDAPGGLPGETTQRPTTSTRDRHDLHRRLVLAHGGEQNCELAMHRRDGSPFFARLESRVVPADGRRPQRWRTTLTDITASRQKQADQLRDAVASLYLDQIQKTEDLTELHLVRGEAINKQYGKGTADDRKPDAVEQEVLASGKPYCAILAGAQGEVLRAVIPTTNQKNYLGKNCLSCHEGQEGRPVKVARSERLLCFFQQKRPSRGIPYSATGLR